MRNRASLQAEGCWLSHGRSEIVEYKHRPVVGPPCIVLRDLLEISCAIRSCRISVIHIRRYLRWHNVAVHGTWFDTFYLVACAPPLSLTN